MKNQFYSILVTLVISLVSFGQDSIQVTKQGIMSDVNIKTDNDKGVIYQRIISWVNSTYKNPKEVLAGQEENEGVIITGYSSNAWHHTSFGVLHYFNLEYKLYIKIYNDSVTFRIEEVAHYTQDGGKFAGSTKSFFKRSGDPKNTYVSAISSLEETLNSLWFSFVEEVKNDSLTSEEALNKLKKAKEKLDLELITQEEYDKIKNELVKFIE